MAYISNGSNAKTFPDFSNNKEVQNSTSRQKVLTYQASKHLYIDMRDFLGLTGKKNPIKNNNDDIMVEISLREQAIHLKIFISFEHNEDIHFIMTGQSFHEYV